MEKLGIDPILIGAQIVNFLLLLFILQRFLYKPILQIIEKRKQNAAEIEMLKKELEEQKEKFEQEHQEVIKVARKEADQIISEAQVRSEKIQEQMQKTAKEKADEIIERTNQELEQKEFQLRESLKDEVAKLAMEVSEKVLSETITPDQKDNVSQKAIDRFIKHGK